MANDKSLGERIKARGVVLQALYEIDCASHEVEFVLNNSLMDLDFNDDNKTFVKTLVRGIRRNVFDIDQKITKFAPAWPIDQIALIDRNVLRIATFELFFQRELPPGVIINEAVELAKAFGGDNAPRFVNGVLSSMNIFIEENKPEGETN